MGIITDRQLQAKQQSTDQWLIEDGPRGAGRFVARITPAGERLFYFRYTASGGDRVRLPIGSYDAGGRTGLTLKDARARAADLSSLYTAGRRDLREYLAQQEVDRQRAEAQRRHEEEEAQRQAELERQRCLTVRQLFDRWQAVHLTPHIGTDGKRVGRKDGGAYVRDQFERRVFPTLGSVPARDLRRSDLLTILDAVKSEGKLRTCNVLLATLKQMLRFGVARDILPSNPLETVSKRDAGGKETERDRVLSADEIKALPDALAKAKLAPRSVRAVWLILATGCRVGELMGAQWAHVDLPARRWHLPQTKNERPHTIHLSEFAAEHFAALAALREFDTEGKPMPWVFPNSAGKGAVCVKSFGKQLADRQRTPDRRMKHRAKNTDSLSLPGGRWTAHDLRRTAATLMAHQGVSTDVIDECLNHMLESRVSRVYIRDRREAEQARAFDALGEHIKRLLLDEPRSNVVPIRGAA